MHTRPVLGAGPVQGNLSQEMRRLCPQGHCAVVSSVSCPDGCSSTRAFGGTCSLGRSHPPCRVFCPTLGVNTCCRLISARPQQEAASEGGGDRGGSPGPAYFRPGNRQVLVAVGLLLSCSTGGTAPSAWGPSLGNDGCVVLGL